MSLQTVLRALTLLAACLIPGGSALAVVNGTPPPCNDRRFDCVGLFFTAGEIPANCGGAVSGTCVLIAPDQILIKRHSLDLAGNQPISTIGNKRYRARFRRAANGDSQNSFFFPGSWWACHGVYQEVFVSRFVDPPVGGSDTVLAYLERPVVNIRPAPLDLNTVVRAGTPIVLVGWGYTGECMNTGDHWTLRYARGKMPYDATGDSFWYTPCGIGSIAPCLTCPSGGPWVSANMHDSGSGIFIEAPSGIPGDPVPELRLLGTVSTTATAHRLTAFNNAGGSPALRHTPPIAFGAISDFNRDTKVDTGDVFDFLPAYFANMCDADLDGNATTTVDDMFSFLAAYFAKQ